MTAIKKLLLDMVNGIDVPQVDRVPQHDHRCAVRQFGTEVSLLYIGSRPSMLVSMLNRPMRFRRKATARLVLLCIYSLLRRQGYYVDCVSVQGT